MFACRSQSALARVKVLKRVPTCLVLSRTEFSTISSLRQASHVEDSKSKDPGTRLPLALQAVWYEPFRRTPTYGLPVCDLQLRSFSVRNLEFMCDFALRAAYYCHLPAAGPIPLPKRTERWTVPKGHFVHKKSQENYERVTHKRLIQIKDGHPETVELWLAFLRKHQYYGVGMKANMFGFDELSVGKRMNTPLETSKDVARPKWSHFGSRKSFETAEKARELLESEEYKSLSHNEVLNEITDVEHFQKLARGILEDPKYKAFVEERKDQIEENAEEDVEKNVTMQKFMTEEEKVQAKTVVEALEIIDGIEAAKPEVLETVDGVGATKPEALETVDGIEAANSEVLEIVDEIEAANPEVLEIVDGVEATKPEALEIEDGVEATKPEALETVDGIEATNPEVLEIVDGVEATNPEALEVEDGVEATKPEAKAQNLEGDTDVKS